MAIKHTIKNDKGELVEVNLSPIKAIRRFCLECMGYQQAEVPRCTAPNCPLFPFRMGESHKDVSPEERKRMSEQGKINAAKLWGIKNEAQNQEI